MAGDLLISVTDPVSYWLGAPVEGGYYPAPYFPEQGGDPVYAPWERVVRAAAEFREVQVPANRARQEAP